MEGRFDVAFGSPLGEAQDVVVVGSMRWMGWGLHFGGVACYIAIFAFVAECEVGDVTSRLDLDLE